MSIKSKIQALITAANTKTGESDTTLTDAVQTLVDGYGQGGGDPYEKLIAANNKTLESFANDTVTKIRAYMFYLCSNLTNINIPNVTTIETTAFQGCGLSGNLTIEKFLDTFASSVFKQNPFTTVTLKGGAIRLDISCFENCRNLTAVDLGDTGAREIININGGAFYNTPSLTALIIRKANGVYPLSSAFPSSSSLSSTATIYVPQALLSAYQSASNWSSYASRIMKIEGTYYETHWANGEAIS